MTQVVLCVTMIVALLQGAVLDQATNPAVEFLDGHRTSFSTKGHAKAKGVSLTIAYPNSWAAAEGERPNIVQKFVSAGGRGLESAMIITRDLSPPLGVVPTTAELQELFVPSELRAMLPSGAVFVDARTTEIEGIPAGILEYTMRNDRAGVVLLVHAWTLNFLSGSTFVQVQFQVGGPAESEGDVAHRMVLFKPLFTLMANSIVLPDLWAAPAEAPAAGDETQLRSTSLPYDDPPLPLLTLAVSFVVTWGIGLTPPLLIRYVFLRRPLNKKSASWIAAGFSVLFWMAFLIVSTALGETASTGAVWIVMFFVSRWIMSRGHEPTGERAGARTG